MTNFLIDITLFLWLDEDIGVRTALSVRRCRHAYRVLNDCCFGVLGEVYHCVLGPVASFAFMHDC
jgi:hypothetical protein